MAVSRNQAVAHYQIPSGAAYSGDWIATHDEWQELAHLCRTAKGSFPAQSVPSTYGQEAPTTAIPTGSGSEAGKSL
jgi:hypothetical protein